MLCLLPSFRLKLKVVTKRACVFLNSLKSGFNSAFFNVRRVRRGTAMRATMVFLYVSGLFFALKKSQPQ